MNRILISVLILNLISCGIKNPDKVTYDSSNPDKVQIDTSKDELNSKDFDRIGFDLMKNESLDKLKLGIRIVDLINILGEPNEKSESEMWGADGEYHQTYKYANLGIEIDLIGENDNSKKVNMITIMSPCEYKTSKDISIGSKYHEVEQSYIDYINPNFTDSTTIVAGSIYGGVIFNFEKGIVKSIFIGASVE